MHKCRLMSLVSQNRYHIGVVFEWFGGSQKISCELIKSDFYQNVIIKDEASHLHSPGIRRLVQITRQGELLLLRPRGCERGIICTTMCHTSILRGAI